MILESFMIILGLLQMTNILIESDSAGATEAQLQAIEQRIGVSLPDQYREFLKVGNGGSAPMNSAGAEPEFRVRWNGQPWAKHFETGMLHYLESADPSAQLSLAVTDDSGYATIRDYIPADLIPIGHDGGGNAVVLGIKGARRGKVFYWIADYASSNNQESPNYDNVGFVADSFSEFLQGLAYDPQ